MVVGSGFWVVGVYGMMMGIGVGGWVVVGYNVYDCGDIGVMCGGRGGVVGLVVWQGSWMVAGVGDGFGDG